MNATQGNARIGSESKLAFYCVASSVDARETRRIACLATYCNQLGTSLYARTQKRNSKWRRFILVELEFKISARTLAEYNLSHSDESWCCPDCWKEALPYHDTSSLSTLHVSASSDSIVTLSRTCHQWQPQAVQGGFLEGRSTVTALLHVTDQWLQLLEAGHDVCAAFFDFRKAFDSVPQVLLMKKIYSLNLDDHIILTNGLGTTSPTDIKWWLSMVQSPPKLWYSQESLRTLFLIYINNLPCVVHNLLSKINLFADNILLYHIIRLDNS